jgi:hypothetical protein
VVAAFTVAFADQSAARSEASARQGGDTQAEDEVDEFDESALDENRLNVESIDWTRSDGCALSGFELVFSSISLFDAEARSGLPLFLPALSFHSPFLDPSIRHMSVLHEAHYTPVDAEYSIYRKHTPNASAEDNMAESRSSPSAPETPLISPSKATAAAAAAAAPSPPLGASAVSASPPSSFGNSVFPIPHSHQSSYRVSEWSGAEIPPLIFSFESMQKSFASTLPPDLLSDRSASAPLVSAVRAQSPFHAVSLLILLHDRSLIAGEGSVMGAASLELGCAFSAMKNGLSVKFEVPLLSPFTKYNGYLSGGVRVRPMK